MYQRKRFVVLAEFRPAGHGRVGKLVLHGLCRAEFDAAGAQCRGVSLEDTPHRRDAQAKRLNGTSKC